MQHEFLIYSIYVRMCVVYLMYVCTYLSQVLMPILQALCDEFPLDRKSNELVKLFRNMRHPLLTYPCILIWAVPRMTYDRLLIGTC